MWANRWVNSSGLPVNDNDPKKQAPAPVIDVIAEPVGQSVAAPPIITNKSEQKPGRFRFRIAMAVAIAIDAVQIGFFPFFFQGAASPFEDILDGAAFLFFWWLLGWNWALLPGFLSKLIPIVDLAPTWTIAVAWTIRANQKK